MTAPIRSFRVRRFRRRFTNTVRVGGYVLAFAVVTGVAWRYALTAPSFESEDNGRLAGQVVGIADGDTLTLLVGRDQYRVLLAEIDTPEKGQPWGNRAKQALSKKVHRKQVTVEIETTDRYGRLVSKVWLGDRDINREMVREGHAWVYRMYVRDRSLYKDEDVAKRAGLGLWSLSDPIPPWEWRRGSK